MIEFYLQISKFAQALFKSLSVFMMISSLFSPCFPSLCSGFPPAPYALLLALSLKILVSLGLGYTLWLITDNHTPRSEVPEHFLKAKSARTHNYISSCI